ncbi:MAG: hypothetical protein ABIZ34_07485 [Candidatus Limnocylindrales bacterium]
MAEPEPEALQTDIYLDWLLNGPSPYPEPDEPTGALRDAAELLQRSLLRFHPSFRFEERLAARLRAEAITDGPVQLGRLIPFRTPSVGAELAQPEGRGRGLIVGGAIASGVSIAGALLMWRRARAPGHIRVGASRIEQAL